MDIQYIYIKRMVMTGMRVAIIGSREMHVTELGAFLPADTELIISGGAKGIDACARDYALGHGIRYVEFLPDYQRYGKAAPLKRNEQIIACADLVIAFWDGKSRGTKHAIDLCRRKNVPIEIQLLSSAPV